MNKIRFIANMDTNYVFHMLSVSKCGYDNAYGEHYAPRYPEEDLAVLKAQEMLITVRGGEHCGALYGIFVCEAACAKSSAKDYYTELIQKATNNDIPVALFKHSEIICQLAAVMIKHYDYYVENIWPVEQSKISQYISTVQHLFEDIAFTEKAEVAVGTQMPHDFFYSHTCHLC